MSINQVGAELFVDGEEKAHAAFRNFADDMKNVGRESASTYAASEGQIQNLRSEIERTRVAAQQLELQFTRVAAANRGTQLGGIASANATEAARLSASASSGLSNLKSGISLEEFEDIRRGAGSARDVVNDLKQAHFNLRRELAQAPESGNSKLFNIAEGVLFRDLIREGIRLVVDYGKALYNSYEEARDAQQRLTTASLDYGQQIQANIEAAQRLALINSGALTGTQSQDLLATALSFAGKAGRPQEAERISQSVLDLAAKRLPPGADAGKILAQYLQGSGSAAEALVGPYSSDEYILSGFAEENKLIEKKTWTSAKTHRTHSGVREARWAVLRHSTAKWKDC